ncbi:MAG TPA: DUF4157 domain-containing protein [Thermoanaerobaculia bacterium]|nr:DUF4157 domain-containing protein [Thermoanaerobaculia bacterium]
MNAPGDAAEREADEVADAATGAEEVITLVDSRDEGAPRAAPGNAAQAGDGEIQRKAVDGAGAGEVGATQIALDTRAGRGQPLPSHTRAAMQAALGANFGDVRIHADAEAAEWSRSLRAQAFTYGSDIYFGTGRFDPDRTEGRRLLAHELAHVVQQRRGRFGAVQRKGDEPKQSITFYVTVDAPVTGAEFFIRAVMTYAGLSHDEAEAKIKAKRYAASGAVFEAGVGPDQVGKPIPLEIEVGGMSKGEKASMAKRTAEINTLPAPERKAINSEADRRFWKTTQHKVGQPLGTGPEEARLREIWLRMREGVMRDHAAIGALPPKIKDFVAPNAATIDPKNYTIVLRIAKRLETFTDGDWALYKRRINASTDDYEKLERALATFAARQEAEKAMIDRIAGLQSLYDQAKAYRKLHREMLTPPLKSDRLPIDYPGNSEKLEAEKASLDAALAAANFSNIEQFDTAVSAYAELFRTRAVELTLLALRESEKTVLVEKQRYTNPNENQKLFDALAPMRKAQEESRQAASAAALNPEMPTNAEFEAAVTSSEKTAEAESVRQKLDGAYPILMDPELNSRKLDVDDAAELGKNLRSNADDRLGSIATTRAKVLEDNDRVFKLKPILDLTRRELGVTSGSIYDSIVNDYQKHLAEREFAVNIALAALAIGLGVLTFGGGTVAVLATGGAVALSTYQLGKEIEKYAEEKAAAHTDFDKARSVSSEEPSLLWVALSLIAVGLDGAALAAAFKAAAPAAKALETGGGLAKLDQGLAEAKGLTKELRETIFAAGKAQEEYRLAVEELKAAMRRTMGRVYMGGIDPDVIAALTKLAYRAVKKGIRDVQSFLAELKLQSYAKEIDLESPEKLKAVTEAFEQASHSVPVRYAGGVRPATFDESGKLVMEGKVAGPAKREEIYKKLGVLHAAQGHVLKTPRKVAEAAKSGNKTESLMASDYLFLKFLDKARADFKAGKVVRDKGPNVAEVFMEATADMGRVFTVPGKVPAGLTGIPFEELEGVVEIPVKRVVAAFNDDGSLRSLYPIAY